MRKLILLAALLVGACDPGVKPAEPTDDQGLKAMKGRIDSLAEGQRNATFLRAIRDAKQPCQAVVGSAYNGEQFGRPSWAARCSDGSDWLVMLDAGGRALVTRRQEAGKE
jgi:hypothetical protein